MFLWIFSVEGPECSSPASTLSHTPFFILSLEVASDKNENESGEQLLQSDGENV